MNKNPEEEIRRKFIRQLVNEYPRRYTILQEECVVRNGNGRADIVTNNTVYEVKVRIYSANHMRKVSDQIIRYNNFFKRDNMVVVYESMNEKYRIDIEHVANQNNIQLENCKRS